VSEKCEAQWLIKMLTNREENDSSCSVQQCPRGPSGRRHVAI